MYFFCGNKCYATSADGICICWGISAHIDAAVCSCRTLSAGAMLGDFVLSSMTEPNTISFSGSGASIFTRDPQSCPGSMLRDSDSLYRSVCNWHTNWSAMYWYYLLNQLKEKMLIHMLWYTIAFIGGKEIGLKSFITWSGGIIWVFISRLWIINVFTLYSNTTGLSLSNHAGYYEMAALGKCKNASHVAGFTECLQSRRTIWHWETCMHNIFE